MKCDNHIEQIICCQADRQTDILFTRYRVIAIYIDILSE